MKKAIVHGSVGSSTFYGRKRPSAFPGALAPSLELLTATAVPPTVSRGRAALPRLRSLGEFTRPQIDWRRAHGAGRRELKLRTPHRRARVRRGVEISCQAVAEQGFRLLGQRTLDLSIDGMMVRLDGASARVGEPVIVTFQAPDTTVWIDVQAVVARILSGRRTGDRAQAIGLSFLKMSDVSRAVLGAQLYNRPPRIPWRRVARDYAATVFSIAHG